MSRKHISGAILALLLVTASQECVSMDGGYARYVPWAAGALGVGAAGYGLHSYWGARPHYSLKEYLPYTLTGAGLGSVLGYGAGSGLSLNPRYAALLGLGFGGLLGIYAKALSAKGEVIDVPKDEEGQVSSPSKLIADAQSKLASLDQADLIDIKKQLMSMFAHEKEIQKLIAYAYNVDQIKEVVESLVDAGDNSLAMSESAGLQRVLGEVQPNNLADALQLIHNLKQLGEESNQYIRLYIKNDLPRVEERVQRLIDAFGLRSTEEMLRKTQSPQDFEKLEHMPLLERYTPEVTKFIGSLSKVKDAPGQTTEPWIDEDILEGFLKSHGMQVLIKALLDFGVLKQSKEKEHAFVFDEEWQEDVLFLLGALKVINVAVNYDNKEAQESYLKKINEVKKTIRYYHDWEDTREDINQLLSQILQPLVSSE